MSKWINFLRHYGTIPNNENMYDETIQRFALNNGIKPLEIDCEYLDELIINFHSNEPKSVVLTGTAGDGKTYYCRKIWLALGGDYDIWQQGKKINELEVDDKTLFIIKDLSELQGEDLSILNTMVDVLCGLNKKHIFLVAANDGQLIEKLRLLNNTSLGQRVSHIIESLLIDNVRENNEISLLLYNLSNISITSTVPKIISALFNHKGWEKCLHCHEMSKCPIWENKSRLQSEAFFDRLFQLLQLLEMDGIHLPIRQILILFVNILLGHPDSKDGLMKCSSARKILDAQSQAKANCYSNVFGNNLSDSKKSNTEVFVALNRFGIGEETTNSIDNLLVFGNDDPDLIDDFQGLVAADKYYGADESYYRAQNDYLEGESEESYNDFLCSLKCQRQRLFFTLPFNEPQYPLWDLTIFKNAGEYLELYKHLSSGNNAPKQVVAKIIKGLNRVNTGKFMNNTDKLFITTSGSYSYSRVGQLIEGTISVTKNRGESVNIELGKDNKIYLIINFTNASVIKPAKLEFTMVRYEFLSRVSAGALPSSFSKECYEDILGFKAKLLNGLVRRSQLEGDNEQSNIFKLLEISPSGDANEKLLGVEL